MLKLLFDIGWFVVNVATITATYGLQSADEWRLARDIERRAEGR